MAPAIANAVFHAKGKGVRDLPIRVEDVLGREQMWRRRWRDHPLTLAGSGESSGQIYQDSPNLIHGP
jgi:hypothetical protein